MGQRKPQPGDRIGLNWRIPGVKGTKQARHVQFDTNFWKTFVHARLATPMGGKGGLTLFGLPSPDGRRVNQHEMFCDHLTSEYGTEVEAKGTGRKVVEWQVKPGRPDNDFMDAVVGCCVAASISGCSLIATQAQAVRVVRRVKLSELQKTGKVWKAQSHG